MTKQEEFIKSLPGDLRPWAEIWLPVIMRWSDDQLTEFITNAAGMPWDAAYEKLVKSMTSDEKVEELKLRRLHFETLNRENTEFIIQQRTFFFSLIARAIHSLTE